MKHIIQSLAVVLSLALILASLPPSALAGGQMTAGKPVVLQPGSMPLGLNPNSVSMENSAGLGNLVAAPRNMMTDIMAIQPDQILERAVITPDEIVTVEAKTLGAQVQAGNLPVVNKEATPVKSKTLWNWVRNFRVKSGGEKVNWDNSAQRPEFNETPLALNNSNKEERTLSAEIDLAQMSKAEVLKMERTDFSRDIYMQGDLGNGRTAWIRYVAENQNFLISVTKAARIGQKFGIIKSFNFVESTGFIWANWPIGLDAIVGTGVDGEMVSFDLEQSEGRLAVKNVRTLDDQPRPMTVGEQKSLKTALQALVKTSPEVKPLLKKLNGIRPAVEKTDKDAAGSQVVPSSQIEPAWKTQNKRELVAFAVSVLGAAAGFGVWALIPALALSPIIGFLAGALLGTYFSNQILRAIDLKHKTPSAKLPKTGPDASIQTASVARGVDAEQDPIFDQLLAKNMALFNRMIASGVGVVALMAATLFLYSIEPWLGLVSFTIGAALFVRGLSLLHAYHRSNKEIAHYILRRSWKSLGEFKTYRY